MGEKHGRICLQSARELIKQLLEQKPMRASPKSKDLLPSLDKVDLLHGVTYMVV